MRTTTMGLVLRATKTGEADRALLLLTPDGLVQCHGKGGTAPEKQAVQRYGAVLLQ